MFNMKSLEQMITRFSPSKTKQPTHGFIIDTFPFN